jgi:hypothetical protein
MKNDINAVSSEIVLNPDKLSEFDLETLFAVNGKLSQTIARVGRAINTSGASVVQPYPEDDDLITLKQAAKMLCVSPDSLYRHPKEFSKLEIREGTRVRFSKAAIRAYIKRKLAKA